MIPEGWTTKYFGEVADYSAGRTPARAIAEYWGGTDTGVPWVSISDMTEFGVISDPKERITNLALEKVFRGKTVPAGTLLMSFKLTIGRVATLGVNACHNEAIISIFPSEGIDQRFLGYFLAQVDYEALQDRQVKGNTLNRDKIDRIKVLLPPPDEQSCIADVLDTVQFSICLQDEILTGTQELKRAAMQTLFTRGLRGEAQKETEIGLVPEGWEVVNLGALGRIGNGSTPKRATSHYWIGGTYPWLTSAKVYDRNIVVAEQFVTESALKECHLPRIKPGAVLIAITGQGKTLVPFPVGFVDTGKSPPTLDSRASGNDGQVKPVSGIRHIQMETVLGHCAVLSIEATINQHLAYVEVDTSMAAPSFVRGYLETQYDFLRQVGAGGGSTKGALTCAFLRGLPVPVPPVLDEQHEIVGILDAIDRKIDLHRRKRAVLEELFRALLHKLMTGEIRAGDLDWEIKEN